MAGAAVNFLVMTIAVSAIACGSRSGSHPVSQGAAPASAGAAAPSSSAPGDAPGSPGQAEPGQAEAGGPARECEALVARVNGCPGLADDVKQAFARSAAVWANEAKASSEDRAAADADCRETAASMRQQLRDLDC